MKKSKLSIEYEYDFELTGLTCPLKGYKLAWELNRALHIKLAKQQDVVVQFRHDQAFSFAHYDYSSTVNRVKLFRNKPSEMEGQRHFLAPEFPHFDYILSTHGDESLHSNRLQEVLRDIPSIQLVAFIPLGALKSKDYFIF
ncbi:MAG: IPExxxVDY family protein [Cyclobacteriaceae bacterium]|jgi:hypothetical protein